MTRKNDITLTYRIESSLDPQQTAESLCHEMSTAQWKRPGVNEDLRPVYGAQIDSIIVQEDKSFSLTINYPWVNFEGSFAVLWSIIMGEGALYCPGIQKIRLLDINIPEEHLKTFTGPQFGLDGLRSLMNIHNRPFFLGVVKPNLGLKPDDFALITHQAFEGGLDIAKDDEMLVNPSYSPLAERVKKCTLYLEKQNQSSENKKLYLANISDDIKHIKPLYDEAYRNRAGAVMINTFCCGFSALDYVRSFSKLPLVGHFTGMALFERIPNWGVSWKVLVKLQRLAGCDIIIMPGFGERMHSKDEDVLEGVQACLEPWGPIKTALPVPGGSDSAKTLPQLYEKIGHFNFGLVAGRGVFSHPEGPKAGAESLHQAWQEIKK